MSEQFSDYKYFKLELRDEDRVLVATLNRPPVNAFIKEKYQELSRIVEYTSKNTDICTLVLKSDAKHFSAGADVNQLGKDGPQEAAIRRSILRKAGFDLYNCPVPVIAAVNGAAVGAGAVFASSADIIIAADNAFFSIPEIDVGVVGGAKGLSRLLPPQKVRSLALTGKRIAAKEVHKLGGVEELVSLDELHEKAYEYANVIADKGTIAVRKWKEALLLTENVGGREGLMIEQCLSQELAWFSPKPTVK